MANTTYGIERGSSYSAGANIYNILKYVYASDKMYQTFNRKRVFGNLIERKKQDVTEGLNFRYNVHTGGTSAGTHMAETTALVGAEAQRSAWLVFNMMSYTHEVNITGQAKYSTKDKKGAMAKAWDFMARNAVKDAMDDFAIAHYTPANGLLTNCYEAVVSNDPAAIFKVANPRRLRVGQRVVVATCPNANSTMTSWVDSTTTNGTTDDTIADITGNQVTLASTLGATTWDIDDYGMANYGVYAYNEHQSVTSSVGVKPFGLEDIVMEYEPRGNGDNDNSYGGVDRAASGNDWAKGRVLDLAGAEITHEKGAEAIDLVEVTGNGEVQFFLTGPEIFRKINALHTDPTSSPVRKNVGGREQVGDGWFQTSRLAGLPVYVDKFCTPGVIYGIDPDNMWIAECKPLDWEDEDGTVIHRMEAYWGYQALLTRMWQICAIPNCHVAIKHVAYDVLAAT